MDVPTSPSPFSLDSTEGVGGIVNFTEGVGEGVTYSSLLPGATSPLTPLPPEVVQARVVRAVYLWVLVGVGVPANAACILTLLSMAQPPYYVALLALADTGALGVKLLFHQLVTHGALTPASCLLLPLPTLFGCYANWVLILISLERFVAVCLPFKKQRLFSRRRIVVSVVGLTVALLTVFAPAFFFYHDAHRSGKKCVVRGSMQVFKDGVWDAGLLASLYFFLPFFLVAILTAFIIRRLQTIRQRRQRVQSGGRSGRESSPEHAVSVMLVSASLLFLLLVLPACLYHLVLQRRFNMHVLKERAAAYLFYQIITVLSDTTHAVNFFVYFLSAAKFRAAFADTVRFCCCYCCPWAGVGCWRQPDLGHSGAKSGVPLTASGGKEPAGDTQHCDTVL
ncbi:hypothetical protein ACOMHN_007401 [Nucella lapillus]